MVTFLTIGLYYIYTRTLYRRRRYYTIIVTNHRYIIKEELFVRKGICSAEIQIAENQISFSHRQLAYVCVDVNRTTWSPSASIFLKFGQYPDWSDIPDDNYASMLSLLFLCFSGPTKRAIKKAYSIDVDAPPLTRMKQMVQASANAASILSFLNFIYWFVIECIISLCSSIFAIMSSYGLDPSIGPRRVTGDYNFTHFEILCGKKEDATVFEKLAELQLLIAKYSLGDGESSSLNVVDDMKKASSSKTTSTEEGKNDVYFFDTVSKKQSRSSNKANNNTLAWDESVLPLAADETIQVQVTDHPYWTSKFIFRTILSFGSYYLAVLSNILHHCEFFVVTNKRFIRFWYLPASLSNGSNGGYTHYRVDYFILPSSRNPNCVFSILPSFDGISEVRALVYVGAFGLLSFDFRKKHVKNGLYALLHGLTSHLPYHPSIVVPEEPNSSINNVINPQATISSLKLLFQNIFDTSYTAGYLTSNTNELEKEYLEVNPLTGNLPDGTCWNYLHGSLHRNYLIVTNKGIYVEERKSNYFGWIITCKTLNFYPWASLQSIYWSNYNFQQQCCSVCCCGCCACPSSCPQINTIGGCIPYGCGKHVDELHGFAGVLVKLVITGQANGLVHAIGLPHRFFGIKGHSEVNDMIGFLTVCAHQRSTFANIVVSAATTGHARMDRLHDHNSSSKDDVHHQFKEEEGSSKHGLLDKVEEAVVDNIEDVVAGEIQDKIFG